MAACLGADLGEGRQLGAVLLHVLLAGPAEIAQRQRNFTMTDQFVGHPVEIREWRWPVLKYRAQRSRAHLLKADRQDTVGRTALNRLSRQEQRGRPGRAVV